MDSFPLITGIVCYLIGLVVGVYSIKGTLTKKIARATQEGIEIGRKEAEEEKEDIGQDLAQKLGKLQATLLDTLDAYQDTVQTVEERLTSAGTKQLSLDYQAGQKALPHAPVEPQQEKEAAAKELSSPEEAKGEEVAEEVEFEEDPERYSQDQVQDQMSDSSEEEAQSQDQGKQVDPEKLPPNPQIH